MKSRNLVLVAAGLALGVSGLLPVAAS
ncbi:MAG: hypothetical protein QOF58_6322, partial [Pseudonocardiales bacterium]|nr:hypothetical protein [Pseudonocardiales bacterium]